MLYSVRSERMLMEQLEYNLLFRWFVGPLRERAWDATSFTNNRERLLSGETAQSFFAAWWLRRGGIGCWTMSTSLWTAR